VPVPVTVERVLAAVVRSRVAYLCPTPAQKRALHDPEGQLALQVLRHLLGARDAIGAPERSPFTEQACQAVARKLGVRVGQKRCRRLIRRLCEAGVLTSSGCYRQPYRVGATRSGFRVALFRLGRRTLPAASGNRKRPVGNVVRVKRRKSVRWWAHPLFGDLCGLPPPGIPTRRLYAMRSLDECFAPAQIRLP